MSADDGSSVNPDASPGDVREIIDTYLSDEDIRAVLKRAARDIRRAYDESVFLDPLHRQDLEAILTAFRVAAGKDRRAQTARSGASSITYETAEIEKLRSQLSEVDPGEEFSRSARVIRDTDRYSRSVTPSVSYADSDRTAPWRR